ncbi:MAG TPA: metalloregulator ArsR/SmtB family transcription factor [Methylomirabilota bacterium]|nr:metalloregulator ArsR/SmtB family transcription factor [Methylomirabilota bacterium]
MAELIHVARAFADPTRVRILAALRGRELCVCELCDVLEIGQSTLSTHLQVIREAGLATTRKEGKWIYYAPAVQMERLVAGVFQFFAGQMARDRHLVADAARLRKRLAERANGACCRGFGKPPTRRRRTSRRQERV